jgi:D-amino-acid dehydrogenase
MAERPNAIVVGAGAIGCSTAYYLSKLGWKVRLLDAHRVGRACSHGNCGYICPSHVLPLTAPGAIGRVATKMFDRDSALYVKPRLDFGLWRWLLRFALRCRQVPMMQAARARHALLQSSMALFREMLASESLEVEWQDHGLLFVYKSPHEFAAYERTAQLVRNEFGIEVTPYDRTQLTKLEPALRSDLAGGWHCPGDAHLRPDRLMTALVPVLESRGVEILEGVRVSRIDVAGGRAMSIETTQGSMAGDVIVLAAGAETPMLSDQIGCRLPIQPGKGYSITMTQPHGTLATPMIFEEYHVAVTPWASGLRIGSTMEFVGYDRSINPRRIELFKRVTGEYLNEPPCGPIQEEWFGWRPMTYDDLPCIGRAPNVGNVIVAAGHGMIGISTMTASGKLASELAAEIDPHIDPAPFAPARFG